MIEIIRHDNELPVAIEKCSWRFHHIDIPTSEKQPGELIEFS
ncbi:MAG: hypothetical protein ACQETJ_06165 [Bacteroidota bacterium]